MLSTQLFLGGVRNGLLLPGRALTDSLDILAPLMELDSDMMDNGAMDGQTMVDDDNGTMVHSDGRKAEIRATDGQTMVNSDDGTMVHNSDKTKDSENTE